MTEVECMALSKCSVSFIITDIVFLFLDYFDIISFTIISLITHHTKLLLNAFARIISKTYIFLL